MFEDLFRDLAQNHRGKIIGGLLGLVFALLFLRFGFWATIFIAVLVAVGYFIGKRLDDTQEDIWDLLDKLLPPGHR